MRKFITFIWLAAIVAFPALVTARANAGEKSAAATSAESESEAVINYCLNISDKATDARVARQTMALKEMETRIQKKIEELDQHRDELRNWVEQQKRLQESAEISLVEIYAAMDPDAAAKQMAKLESRIAVSVLHKLKPRQASSILNEMPADQAAKLILVLAAATERERPRK